jgi:hypothetical protein
MAPGHGQSIGEALIHARRQHQRSRASAAAELLPQRLQLSFF